MTSEENPTGNGGSDDEGNSAPTLVSEIMDPDPPTVGPDDDVETVVEALHRVEARSAVVVGDDGRVVGIVTDSDLVLEDEKAKIHLPPYLNIMGGIVFLEPLRGFERRIRKAYASEVSEMMTPNPETVAEETTVREAAKAMSRGGHRQMPVVDTDHRLAGMLNRIDVLAALAEE